MRRFGLPVSLPAAACEIGDKVSSDTTTVNMLNCVDNYLDWEAVMGSGDDDEAVRLIELARAAASQKQRIEHSALLEYASKPRRVHLPQAIQNPIKMQANQPRSRTRNIVRFPHDVNGTKNRSMC